MRSLILTKEELTMDTQTIILLHEINKKLNRIITIMEESGTSEPTKEELRSKMLKKNALEFAKKHNLGVRISTALESNQAKGNLWTVEEVIDQGYKIRNLGWKSIRAIKEKIDEEVENYNLN